MQKRPPLSGGFLFTQELNMIPSDRISTIKEAFKIIRECIKYPFVYLIESSANDSKNHGKFLIFVSCYIAGLVLCFFVGMIGSFFKNGWHHGAAIIDGLLFSFLLICITLGFYFLSIGGISYMSIRDGLYNQINDSWQEKYRISHNGEYPKGTPPVRFMLCARIMGAAFSAPFFALCCAMGFFLPY
jgi:hypothetical protein